MSDYHSVQKSGINSDSVSSLRDEVVSNSSDFKVKAENTGIQSLKRVQHSLKGVKYVLYTDSLQIMIKNSGGKCKKKMTW